MPKSKRTLALYIIPTHKGEQAERFGTEESTSFLTMRQRRKAICTSGLEVAIHISSTGEHPELLPFGSTLWREAGAKRRVPINGDSYQ